MNLSIGALSTQSGVPANTLRTWERRYGFPSSERTEGNQRVYAPEVVEHVRYVAAAIERGHRPSNVMGASLGELRALLGPLPPANGLDPVPPRQASLGTAGDWITASLEAARALDPASLGAVLRARIGASGVRAFVFEDAPGLLVAVGEAWAGGALSISAEHFLSESLGGLLREAWGEPLPADAPSAVFATLTGETHVLGLHLAACVTRLAGWRVRWVGADVPVADVAEAALASGARAVLVSVPITSPASASRWQLLQLRERLGGDVQLVVGGGGQPGELPGVVRVTRLDQLEGWLVGAARRG